MLVAARNTGCCRRRENELTECLQFQDKTVYFQKIHTPKGSSDEGKEGNPASFKREKKPLKRADDSGVRNNAWSRPDNNSEQQWLLRKATVEEGGGMTPTLSRWQRRTFSSFTKAHYRHTSGRKVPSAGTACMGGRAAATTEASPHRLRSFYTEAAVTS